MKLHLNLTDKPSKILLNMVTNKLQIMEVEYFPSVLKDDIKTVNITASDVIITDEELKKIVNYYNQNLELPELDLKNENFTSHVIKQAMDAVSKDVRQPKCVRDGLVKPEEKNEHMLNAMFNAAFFLNVNKEDIEKNETERRNESKLAVEQMILEGLESGKYVKSQIETVSGEKIDFIPFEQAMDLKELGFDESCMAWYDTRQPDVSLKTSHYHSGKWNYLESAVSSPLYQQAFRWFRKKHDLQYNINKVNIDEYYYEVWGGLNWRKSKTGLVVKTYEEAELNCLKKLIEIVQK